ncbi:hypothetical protein ALP29_200135 [Pseudomonas syringae pv. avii]|uniref:Uncharacterized protein n=1 Tax=Pseudomonas syringae pv. avii TaxID=663959 RepID=A0A3M5UDF1_PSESX|nr:hypothetical protein ALP29_200135 [Pseudomonas syringae pv. avii]
MIAAQVGADEAQCITAHLRQVVVTAKREQVQVEVHKRSGHRRHNRQQQHHVACAPHVNRLRNKRLS